MNKAFTRGQYAFGFIDRGDKGNPFKIRSEVKEVVIKFLIEDFNNFCRRDSERLAKEAAVYSMSKLGRD